MNTGSNCDVKNFLETPVLPIIFQDHHIHIYMFVSTPHRKPLSQSCDCNVLVRLHGALGFAMPQNCRGISLFRLVCQGEYVVRCPPVRKVWPGQLSKERKVPWVSFLGDHPSLVSLGLLVTFACRSGLNNRGGVSRDSRGGRDPTNNSTNNYAQK